MASADEAREVRGETAPRRSAETPTVAAAAMDKIKGDSFMAPYWVECDIVCRSPRVLSMHAEMQNCSLAGWRMVGGNFF